MPQHPQFGFQLAPEISAAEREAVSTLPGSSLQRAIRSTQQSTEFHTPKELLLRGPQAFRIAKEAEKERREMMVGRAQQGINLSNIAISQRGVQRKHDARRAEERQAADFVERTRGMDYRDALSSLTPQDATSPLTLNILRNMDVLDVAKRSLPKRELEERSVKAALSVPEESLQKEQNLQTQRNIALLEGTLEKLRTEDVSDPINLANMLSQGGLSPEVSLGIMRRAKDDPESVRQIARALQVSVSAAKEGLPYNPGMVNDFLEVAGQAVTGFAQGKEMTDEDLLKLMIPAAQTREMVGAYQARKAALDMASQEAAIQYRIARSSPSSRTLSLSLKAEAERLQGLFDLADSLPEGETRDALLSAFREGAKAHASALKRVGATVSPSSPGVFPEFEVPEGVTPERAGEALDILESFQSEEEEAPSNELSVDDDAEIFF